MVESFVVDLYVSIIHHQDKGHTHTHTQQWKIRMFLFVYCHVASSNIPFFSFRWYARVNRARTCVSNGPLSLLSKHASLAAEPLNRHFYTLLVPLAEQRGRDASFVLGT